MFDIPKLLEGAQRDAYDALAEHCRQVQSDLWLDGYFWRSFQGAMAFLSVAVTMRVLDCVIFAAQALRAEQQTVSPEPEVGYRLKRGILVPKPHAVDQVRRDRAQRRTRW